MYRDGTTVRTEDHVHFLMTHAALGDLITSLPAIIYARTINSLDLGFTLWVPEHQMELVEHLIGGPGIQIKALHLFDTKTHKRSQAGPAVVNCGLKNTVTRNKMDMVTFGFVVQLDTIPRTVHDMNYPHWSPLTGERTIVGDYVVISSGATSDNKIFHPRIMAEVVTGLKSRGLNVVILGKSETHVKASTESIVLKVRDTFERMPKQIQDMCVDMRDKTTLMEARDIIGHASAIIGVDGGMLHLAGTTDCPIVYGITSVDPDDRGITRHDTYNWNVKHVWPKELECAGCQSHWVLVFTQDFRECAYEDNKCVEELKSAEMLEALDELLKPTGQENDNVTE
jgi:hypothetical protein